MTQVFRHWIRTAAVALAIFAATACSDSTNGSDCDRECLIEFGKDYLDAIISRNAASIRLAEDIVFVENVTRMDIGDGLWGSAAGAATDFRIIVPDPDESSVGIMAVINRQTNDDIVPAQLAARLKIDAGQITEVEHLVADVAAEVGLTRLEAPRSNITATIPERQRMPRAELAAIANAYYEALDRSDGELAPFAADCERQENGMITASYALPPATFESVDVDGRSPPPVARDCIGQMSSRRFAYIDSIDNRRVFAIDPIQGLAMGFSHFRQSMSRGPHLMIAADGTELMWDEQREPYDLPAAHVFKIAEGEIHEVEAIGIFVPFDSPSGWE